MGEGCEILWDCCSGVSKANSRSGLVCLLGEVLELWRSCISIVDFCDNMPRDVVAGLLFWGVMISKRRG